MQNRITKSIKKCSYFVLVCGETQTQTDLASHLEDLLHKTFEFNIGMEWKIGWTNFESQSFC